MNLNYLLHSLVSLFVATFFLLLGILSLLIPWHQTLKASLIHFFLENSIAISLFGFAFIVVGTAIIIQIILSTKRGYYTIRSGQNSIKVDRLLIKGYLDSYLNDLLPEKEIPNQLVIRDNKIYVTADLPSFPLGEQKSIVEKVEKDLSEMFSKVLGYRNDFFLSLSFLETNESA